MPFAQAEIEAGVRIRQAPQQPGAEKACASGDEQARSPQPFERRQGALDRVP